MSYTWNRRIMRRKTRGGYCFAIHYVFYRDEKVDDWKKPAAFPVGASLKELRENYVQMGKAFKVSPLDFKTGKEIAK